MLLHPPLFNRTLQDISSTYERYNCKPSTYSEGPSASFTYPYKNEIACWPVASRVLHILLSFYLPGRYICINFIRSSNEKGLLNVSFTPISLNSLDRISFEAVKTTMFLDFINPSSFNDRSYVHSTKVRHRRNPGALSGSYPIPLDQYS